MRVRAKFATEKEFGWYGNNRRFDGDEFVLKDKAHFSKIWMEKVDEGKTRKSKKAEVEEVEPVIDDEDTGLSWTAPNIEDSTSDDDDGFKSKRKRNNNAPKFV